MLNAASQPYEDEQPSYVPSELVASFCPTASVLYHCYLIELKQDFDYEVPICDVVLGMRSELECDIATSHFDLQVGRGIVTVKLNYVGNIELSPEQVRHLILCCLCICDFIGYINY